MFKWLKLSLVRDVLIIVMVGVLSFIFVWRPADLARDTIKTQSDLHSKIQKNTIEAVNYLGSIPDPALIKPRQVGSFAEYARRVESWSKKLNAIEYPEANVPKKIIGIPIGKRGKAVSDVNNLINSVGGENLYKSVYNNLSSATKLAAYEAATSRALVNLLEYNAIDDTAQFDPGSPDTEKRIELAKNGLQKTLEGLSIAKTKYQDNTLDTVISEVRNLQKQLDSLSRQGNKKAWIASINAAQDKILSNRSRYWSSNFPLLTKQLQKDQENISKLQKMWQNLAIKYSV